MDYLMLVIEGWKFNPDFLTDYFYREFKKAEAQNISLKEFHFNVFKVLKEIRNETIKPYYQDLDLWHKYVVQQRRKGLKEDMAKPEMYDTGIPLFHMTNQKFTGHITGKDVDHIESSLNEAYVRLLGKDGRDKNDKLSDLFVSEAAYAECIDALKKVANPIISEDNKYLLGAKQKGAFTAWYFVIKLRQKLKPNVLVSDLVRMLNQEIEGLNLGKDGSTLRREETTMFRKYKVPLSKLIV